MNTMTIIICSGCAGFVLGALVVAFVYHFKLVQVKEELSAQRKRYNLQQRIHKDLNFIKNNDK